MNDRGRWKENERGGYRYLPGITPYSCGVVASPGNEIVHVALEHPLPWRKGMERVRAFLLNAARGEQNLCGVELRCPEPFPMNGFVSFNKQYRELLEDWQLILNGENPIARTNVAPVVNAPSETLLYGFSYCEPSACRFPTFVIAGGGELPEGSLQEEQIIRRGETSSEALLEKAVCVVDIMRARLQGLSVDERQLTAIDVYTEHPMQMLLEQVVIPRLPMTAKLGIRWFYSRPPVKGIEFEMDMRGVRRELIVALGGEAT